MNPLLRLTSLVLAVACTAGCTLQRINESMARTQSETDAASQYTAYLRNQQQEPKRDTVVFSKKPWVSTQPISAKRGLPTALDCELAYRPGDRVGITEIAQYITSECGLPVLVSPDAFNPGLAAVTSPPSSGAARPAGGDPDNLSDLLPAGVVGAAGQPASVSRGPSLTSFSSFGQTTQIANLTYKGKLSGLLDLATARLGLTWRYSPAERAVRISYVDTRVFEVWSFGDSQVIESVVKSGMTTNTGTSNGTSGGGGGGGSGSSSSGASGQSGSNQSTTVTLRSTILTDVKNNVQAMLSPAGRLYLSTSTGTLTVTDRPEVLARVETYLNETNRKITQQVLFNVRVLEVTLTDQDQLGLNWDVVYKSLANKWGLSLANTLADISTNAISGSVGILDTAHSPWAGSNLIVKALAEQGRISTVREPSLTTLNLQPAPIQIGNVKGYIESSSTTTTASVGSNTALQAATITSGFNMTLLPRLLSQDEMLLMVSINMSSKPTFDVFQSNGSSAQTPDYDTKVLSPKIKLRSGQTLILSGFDESREDATKIGAGKPGFLGLGGSQSRTSTRSVLVVLITPIVIGSNTALQPSSIDLGLNMTLLPRFPSLEALAPKIKPRSGHVRNSPKRTSHADHTRTDPERLAA